MPQEFQVVRCCACSAFQVEIKKKSLKWQCKLCNKKQELKKVYGESTSAECRRQVQKLNMQRGDVDKVPIDMDFSSKYTKKSSLADVQDEDNDGPTAKQSKWNAFIDSESSSLDSDVETNDEKHEESGEKQDQYLPQTSSGSISCSSVIQKSSQSETSIPIFANVLNNVAIEELDSIFEL
uniref:MRN complex-interacting protein N-terminal domain-containing protein n=1 Tax=Strigamia maritima TaxID=126957 RepID=T1JCR3_STRMM